MSETLQVRDGKRERDISLDLIRTVAAFLVLSVHFFLKNGFYGQPMVGKRMLLMCAMRMGFMTCVPLFLLLTGYLCRKKELTGRYYLGLVRVLVTYLLCGLICMGVRIYLGEAMSFRHFCGEFLAYNASPYGWYIEMYIGLFLLIPFLNALWRGLETKKRRLALIATLLALVTLPALTNGRWNILPDWWKGIYPLLYYFLGMYFGEYQTKPRWGQTLIALLGVTTLAGYVAYLLGVLNPAHTFVWCDLTDWTGPLVVAEACLLFLVLKQVPMDRAPGWLRWVVGKCAQLSLGIYLLSWCFDAVFYPILAEKVPMMLDRLFWYPVVVPAVFICSALLAQLAEWVRMGISYGLNRMFPNLRLK